MSDIQGCCYDSKLTTVGAQTLLSHELSATLQVALSRFLLIKTHQGTSEVGSTLQLNETILRY